MVNSTKSVIAKMVVHVHVVASVLLLISTHSSSAYSNSYAFLGRGRGQCSQPNRHRPILTKQRINFTPTLSSRKTTRTTTSSSTTTSLRGIDYEAIENSSTTNADEYSDFDTSTTVQLQLLPTSNDLLTPKEIVSICMSYLQRNSKSSQQAVGDQQTQAQQHHQQPGLEICYNFSSDSCRMANGGSLESFLQHANNPVFQCMVDCDLWEIVNVGSIIKGTQTRGDMQTVLVHVVPNKTKPTIEGALLTTSRVTKTKKTKPIQRNSRRFIWTLMKERRPPRQGHFLVHECIAVDNAFAHTL
mmetsp:Transcript_24852/g.27838  ORF Transcript_24852/g.27838 Transcript_24852/m.27838 type:complete len:300 (-) Transcript_24852:124-1023(-)